MLEHYGLDEAAHLIQVALTPVFLLSGIAALLNVFAGRLARVADQLTALTAAIQKEAASAEQNEQLGLLRRRLLMHLLPAGPARHSLECSRRSAWSKANCRTSSEQR